MIFGIDSLQGINDMESMNYFYSSSETMIFVKESALFKPLISVDTRKCDEIPLNYKVIGHLVLK